MGAGRGPFRSRVEWSASPPLPALKVAPRIGGRNLICLLPRAEIRREPREDRRHALLGQPGPFDFQRRRFFSFRDFSRISRRNPRLRSMGVRGLLTAAFQPSIRSARFVLIVFPATASSARTLRVRHKTCLVEKNGQYSNRVFGVKFN
jgi:hypothetical protein